MTHKAYPRPLSLLSPFAIQRESPRALPQHRRGRSLPAEQLCYLSYVEPLQFSIESVQLSTDGRLT